MSLLGYNKKTKTEQNKTKQSKNTKAHLELTPNFADRVAFEKIHKDLYDISNVFTHWNDVYYNYYKEIKCNRLSIKLLL